MDPIIFALQYQNERQAERELSGRSRQEELALERADALEAALRREFQDWIAHHPHAGLFDWAVAADNVRGALKS